MTKIRVLDKQEAKSLKGKTNGEKLKKLANDSHIKKTIKEDLDAKELTDYELNQFGPFVFLKNKLILRGFDS